MVVPRQGRRERSYAQLYGHDRRRGLGASSAKSCCEARGLDLAVHREQVQRLALDLPDALPREAELAADLLERLRIGVAVQSESQLHDPALAVGKLGDCAAQRVLLEADVDLLLGAVLVDGDDVPEGRVALVADRLVEARDRAGRVSDLAHLLDREL